MEDRENLAERIARVEAELEVYASVSLTLSAVMEGLLALVAGAKDEGERRAFAQIATKQLREVRARIKVADPPADVET